MNPVQAIRSVFGNYAAFDGRASRSEYWWYALMDLLLGVLFQATLPFNLAVITSVAWFVVSVIPGLAVFVRRLHDTGRSGWWWLLAFIPIVGALVLLVWLLMDSRPDPNDWGPPPPGSSWYRESTWVSRW